MGRSRSAYQERYARSCEEIEELIRRCYQEGNGLTRQKLNEYCPAGSGISNSESITGSNLEITRPIGVY